MKNGRRSFIRSLFGVPFAAASTPVSQTFEFVTKEINPAEVSLSVSDNVGRYVQIVNDTAHNATSTSEVRETMRQIAETMRSSYSYIPYSK